MNGARVLAGGAVAGRFHRRRGDEIFVGLGRPRGDVRDEWGGR